jgi:hypothetical protein
MCMVSNEGNGVYVSAREVSEWLRDDSQACTMQNVAHTMVAH